MVDEPPNTPQTIMRSPFTFTMAVSTLWQHLILSAVVTVLAFVLFGLVLAWDTYLWRAVVAFPIGCLAAIYATWCVMMLQRAKD